MKKIIFATILSFSVGFGSSYFIAESHKATPADATVEGLVNGSRMQINKRPIQTETRARICARRHTVKMMQQQDLHHSSNQELRACLPATAKYIGENVGVGASATEIHSLMLSSNSHNNVMKNTRWRYLGGSAEYDGYSYWVTQQYWSP